MSVDHDEETSAIRLTQARSLALERISAAGSALAETRRASDARGREIATRRLDRAVADGRDLDLSWQSIGDALGMRRGAAYQRFRPRTERRRSR